MLEFRDHFSGQSEEYSRHRPTYPESLFDYLAALAPSLEKAWDCGTGNGQAALALAGRFQRVIATDASANQIQNAFPNERIEYRVEPSERTSIDPHSIDLITAGTAVHWFDFEAFYQEVRRVGKPRAVLAVWTYHLPRVRPEVDSLLEKYYRETLDGYWPDRIRYLEQLYRTLPFPFKEIKPPVFQMEAEWNVNDMIGFLASWSGTRGFIEKEGHDPLVGIAASLERYWGGKDRIRRVLWPLHFRIGRLAG
jgi:SAM-dependent methyltransferase